jgi:hypothetical protein
MRKSSENIFQSFTHGQNWNFGGGGVGGVRETFIPL